MRKQEIRYQSLDYKFPKKLWAAVVWLKDSKGELVPYSLPIVNKSSKETYEYAQKTITDVRNGAEKIDVIDNILVIPLTFSGLFPLKKEYWESPFVPEEILSKTISFLTAFTHPNLNKIMITPTLYTNRPKKIYLTAAFVFRDEDKNYLEEMVKASHHPVCVKYKNSAIYNIGESFAYDLKKQKVYVNVEALPN